MTDKKRQTAMQDLIDHIKDRLIAAKELGMDTYYIENILENAIISLPVEKEQIKDALRDGLKGGTRWWGEESLEAYYNETYESND